MYKIKFKCNNRKNAKVHTVSGHNRHIAWYSSLDEAKNHAWFRSGGNYDVWVEDAKGNVIYACEDNKVVCGGVLNG